MSKKKQQKQAALAAGQVALLKSAADTIRAQKAALARQQQAVSKAARLAPPPLLPQLDGYTMARLSAELATAAREPAPAEHHDPREREYSAAMRDAALGAAYDAEIHIQKLWAPAGFEGRAPGDLARQPHHW